MEHRAAGEEEQREERFDIAKRGKASSKKGEQVKTTEKQDVKKLFLKQNKL